MLIETHSRGNVIVVELLEKHLSASSTPDFNRYIEDIVKRNAGPIIIDLSAVEFMDSSGLGGLVSVVRMMDDKSAIKVVGIRGSVAKLFKLTRMDRVFNIFDSVVDALADSKS